MCGVGCAKTITKIISAETEGVLYDNHGAARYKNAAFSLSFQNGLKRKQTVQHKAKFRMEATIL